MRTGSGERPPVSFYLPCTPAEFIRLPTAIEHYWAWQTSEAGLVPHWGRYHWVLQSFLQLRAAGYPARLVREMPDAGIVVSHVDCFDYGLRPHRDLYLVVLLVDREVPHPHAQWHITHNPVQTLPMWLPFSYMAPWPQVGLVPRRAERGSRFERMAFVGYRQNLMPQLATPQFSAQLRELGLELVIPEPAGWADFSDFDAVLAVRSFGRDEIHLNKPALKLYNAWLAGVPAVLGHEIAYVVEGGPGRAYLEATNEAEVLAALRRLAGDASLRQALMAEGRQRVAHFSEERLREAWVALFERVLLPDANRWMGSAPRRVLHRGAGAIRERLLWRRPGWFGQLPTPSAALEIPFKEAL